MEITYRGSIHNIKIIPSEVAVELAVEDSLAVDEDILRVFVSVVVDCELNGELGVVAGVELLVEDTFVDGGELDVDVAVVDVDEVDVVAGVVLLVDDVFEDGDDLNVVERVVLLEEDIFVDGSVDLVAEVETDVGAADEVDATVVVDAVVVVPVVVGPHNPQYFLQYAMEVAGSLHIPKYVSSNLQSTPCLSVHCVAVVPT